MVMSLNEFWRNEEAYYGCIAAVKRPPFSFLRFPYLQYAPGMFRQISKRSQKHRTSHSLPMFFLPSVLPQRPLI